MRVEIDQSARIEETNRDSVLALGNEKVRFSVRVSARVKRQLKKTFREQGKPKLFSICVFAVAVVLLLKKSGLKPEIIVIDIEYPGYDKVIKEIIQQNIKRRVEIEFKSIGKSSVAHEAAYFTYKKKSKEDKTLTFEEIAKLAIKKDRGSLRT